jgi:hypothetical protein
MGNACFNCVTSILDSIYRWIDWILVVALIVIILQKREERESSLLPVAQRQSADSFGHLVEAARAEVAMLRARLEDTESDEE